MTPPLSTSETLLHTVPRPLLLLPLLTCLVAFGPFGKKQPAPTSPTPSPVVQPAADMPTIWSQALPVQIGAPPTGLANISAQSCAACHFGAHEDWHGGAHAQSSASIHWRAMAAEVGMETCDMCHLPLREQRPSEPAEPGSARVSWPATLVTEGVTCAACHIRDGHVVGANPVTGAPHPVLTSEDFSSSAMCAACHQMDIVGAEYPLYDTYGEWSRSAYAKAGVSCQDCHYGPGAAASQTGAGHGPVSRAGRGLSALLFLDSDEITRGGTATRGTLVLQNTGAGHHIPSGSPFAGMDLSLVLVIDAEEPWQQEVARWPLARSVEAAPPYRTTADTRLAAGEQRTLEFGMTVPQDAPGGPLQLQLLRTPTLTGTALDRSEVMQVIPLSLD